MNAAPQLWMSRHLAERIRSHGAESYPHECCGALLGRDRSLGAGTAPAPGAAEVPREVLAVFPLVNRREDSPRNRFSLSPDDVRAADKAAREQHLELLGWYHSHPDHPARPSEYDRENAWPWYSYIIVSVRSGTPENMTSWRLADDRLEFLPEAIEVRQQAAV
jgi:proteasome lid subunit RPN8/RPN11